MTPKELYDWAVEHGAQDYDILVDGDARFKTEYV